MNNNSSSNSTKQKIYECSKCLFYEKGYLNTTIKNIAEDANVNRALISYYFNGKASLAQEIVNEFSKKVIYIIKKETDQNYNIPIHPLLMFVLSTKVFTSFRRLNDNYKRFIKEVAFENIVIIRNLQLDLKVFDYLESNNNIKFNKVEKQIYQNSLTSIVRGLMIVHSNGEIDCSHEYLAEKQCEMFFKILGIDQGTIDSVIQESRSLFSSTKIMIDKNFEVISPKTHN